MNRPRGFRIWFAVTGGIAAWLAHLIAVSSLAQRTCNQGSAWVVDMVTVGLALVVVVAIAMSYGLIRAAGTGRTEDETSSLVFLGWFGVILGAANLLLILFEGSMPLFVGACR